MATRSERTTTSPRHWLRIAGLLLALLWGGPWASGSEAVLVLGVFPRFDAPTTMRLFSPLAAHLSSALAREVRLETSKDFQSFWQAVIERRFDLVHFNQYHYVRAHALYGYEAILCNEERGSRYLAGAFYTRRDSGIDELAELRGKRILFGGGPDAMMSYIVPLDLLRRAGVRPWEYQQLFAVSPSNALIGAYLSQADAAGVGTAAPWGPKVREMIDPEEMRVIAQSEPILQLPWAVKSDMPQGLRERIQELLSRLGQDEAGWKLLHGAGLSGLRPVRDRDYDPHRRIIGRVLGEEY